MAVPGQGAEMSEVEFSRLLSEREFVRLCDKAYEGKTAEVLAAVDQDRRLATKANGNGWTLLICACYGDNDNPQLAQGLLERGANAHARGDSVFDALIYVAIATWTLDHRGHRNSNSQHSSALSIAASKDHLQMCLLLISRRANLMLALVGGTAVDRYGEVKYPSLTPPDELEQRRATVLTAFEQGPHPDMCWERRWPFVCVLVGCDLQPLAARKAYLLMINPPLPPDAVIPAIPIGTPELYRAYLHGCIFAHPGFWKLIAAFL